MREAKVRPSLALPKGKVHTHKHTLPELYADLWVFMEERISISSLRLNETITAQHTGPK